MDTDLAGPAAKVRWKAFAVASAIVLLSLAFLPTLNSSVKAASAELPVMLPALTILAMRIVDYTYLWLPVLAALSLVTSLILRQDDPPFGNPAMAARCIMILMGGVFGFLAVSLVLPLARLGIFQ